MKNMIKKAFDMVKDNIILAQPLVIFLVIISLTTAGLYKQTNHVAFLFILIANILLITAFFSGWFYMIKKGATHMKKVENEEYKNDEEKTAASFGLIKEFFPGVGEYFIPMSFTIITYCVVYALIIFLCIKLGLRFLPDPHIDYNKIMSFSGSSMVEIQKYISTFSYAQLKAINLWMLYVGTTSAVFTFLTLFLFPAVYDKKDFILFAPFTAFNRNLIFIFKNFIGVLGILIFLSVLNFVLSFLSIFFNLNVILSIVGLIVSFYFMTYAVALIFLYYEEKK